MRTFFSAILPLKMTYSQIAAVLNRRLILQPVKQPVLKGMVPYINCN